jgi:hypothetical protein
MAFCQSFSFKLVYLYLNTKSWTPVEKLLVVKKKTRYGKKVKILCSVLLKGRIKIQTKTIWMHTTLPDIVDVFLDAVLGD